LEGDKFKTEGNRLKGLSKNGTFIPQSLIDNSPTKGRSRDELLAIAQNGGTPQDIKFATSRDVNDLKGSGQSIINYATFAEHDPNWFNRPIEERTAYANQLLDQGLVSEGKGSVDVDWNNAPPLPSPSMPERNADRLQ
jgi:hypothetical protein